MRRSLWLLVAALALVAVACGGDEAASEVASLDAASTDTIAVEASTSESQSAEEQLLAFTECLRDEGLDVGDPTVDADGNVQLGGIFAGLQEEGQQGPPEGFQDAFDVCGDLLEDLQLGFAGGDQTEFQDQILEFAQCMRDNGYDMDDPDFSAFAPGGGGDGQGPGAGGGPFGDIDFDDPDFQAAQEACADILAGFGPGVGGGAPGG